MTRNRESKWGIYQGSPCFRGHSGRRYARTANCVECAQERAKNPPKIKSSLQTLPRTQTELVAICKDHCGTTGAAIAATVATADSGLRRCVILHDGSVKGMTEAIREAADWIDQGAKVPPGKAVY